MRNLSDALTLKLQAGNVPALVLTQGERGVRVELPHVKDVVAALVDAAADLDELLAAGDVYHA